jgi:sodium/bile acid cotransporter 7
VTPRPSTLLRKLDPFLVGLFVSLLLAAWFPELGSRGGPLHPRVVNPVLTAGVFFTSGLTLPFDELRRGATEWRAHVLVQVTTFAAFPLLGALLALFLSPHLGADFVLGLLYLCALPSTVSSCTALTAVAGGRVSVAVFNATLSSLLGIFLTPLWIATMANATLGRGLPLATVILDLCLWLALPLLLGQLSRRWLADWAQKHLKTLRWVDRLAILFLVYTSFCDSFQARVWQDQSATTLWASFGLSTLLLSLALTGSWSVAKRLALSRQTRIAVLFCGSTKSLVHGVLMAQLLFANSPRVGLLLLPIMTYHPLQLIVGGALARRFARAHSEETPHREAR